MGFFSIFSWIRKKTAEAFARGATDFMEAITPEGEEVPTNLGELQALMARAAQPKALAAAEETEPAKKKGR